MPSAKIVVVGSSNTDLVVRVDRLPGPGETVIGGDLQTIQGGKGANQAVAASRLGASVAFVARVGEDSAGQEAIAAYQLEGIDTRHVLSTQGVSTGTALIPVERSSGRNAIVVAPGANQHLSPEDVRCATATIQQADMLVVSLEIPLPAVVAAIDLAWAAGIPVLCNPAPAIALPDLTLSRIRWMTPNDEECIQMGGVDRLLSYGIEVVSTHGELGAVHHTPARRQPVPAPAVAAVDTVAAGDCFTAALAVRLAEGASTDDAIRFAVRAASLKVTRHGAQPGLPHRAEVDMFPGQPDH